MNNRHPVPFAWTEAAHDRLRDLWAGGVTTIAIARIMGTNKNSIIGKAHRLKLPPRPSPIARRAVFAGLDAMAGAAPNPVGKSRSRKPSAFLPHLGSAVPVTTGVAISPPDRMCVAANVADDAPVPRYSSDGCQFPHGHPGHAGFRFCGQRTLLGQSWCAEHRRTVFVRRDVAAGVVA